jgi:phosphatidate cytidylyltransferase
MQLRKRIVTGVLAGALFLAMLCLGGYWFAGLILAMAAVGFWEYVRMNRLNNRVACIVAGLAALLIAANATIAPSGFDIRLSVWLPMFVLLAITVFTGNKVAIDQAAVLLLGVVYLGFGFHYMIATRLIENGIFWTLFVFSCIWATDSGAYFTGYALGKHKLCPAISPNKTVEGAVGGVLFSVAVALCFSLYAPKLLTAGTAIALGLTIGVVGQLGDLIQSAYKRVKGIKDTGAILPGHGGVLDRVDSWLIVFPFLHLFSLLPGT